MFNPQSWTQDMLIQLSATDTDSIVSVATYPSGNIPLVGGGVVNLINPSFLIFTTAADESANIYTIVGIDVNGENFTTTLVGPNASTAVLSIAVAQVISISQLNNGAGNLSIGNTSQTYSAWVPIDKNSNQFAVEFLVGLSAGATLNYTVQFAGISPKLDVEVIQNDSILNAQTAAGSTFLYNEPFDAARLMINSWTSGQAYFLVRPSGLATAGSPPIQI